MPGRKMVKVDGTFYTPEDLKAKQDREAAAEARADREASELAKRVASKTEDEVLAAAIEVATAPLRDQVESLTERVRACEEAHEAGENATGPTGVPEGGGSPASGADSGGSDDAKPAKAAAKTAKGASK